MLRLRALLDEVLARTVQRGALPDGATVLGLEPFGATAFTLRVRAGQEKVDLIISAAKPGERCFFKIGPLAFTHPKDQPIESPVQKRVLRALGHRLRFALREMAEEASGSND